MPTSPGPSADQSASALATLGRLSHLREQALHRTLTEDEQAELEQERPCMHCGGHHVRSCPRVKRIVFASGSGQIAEVEYFAAADIDWTGVVFEDVGGEEAEPDLPLADIRSLTDLVVQEWEGNGDLPALRTARRLAAWLDQAK